MEAHEALGQADIVSAPEDVYKRQVEYRAVKEDVNLRIMDIMAGEGASFAFPSRSIYIENAPSLPDGKGGLQ